MYVKIDGVEGTLKALGMFEPDLAKEIGKELNAAGRVIRDDARGFASELVESPMSGWRYRPPLRSRGRQRSDGTFDSTRLSRGGAGWPPWNAAAYLSSIKSSRREYRLTVSSSFEPSLMIYELAGTKGGKGKNSVGSPQAAQFLRNLPALPQSGPGKRTGRILVRALVKNYADTKEAIKAATERAVNALDGRL